MSPFFMPAGLLHKTSDGCRACCPKIPMATNDCCHEDKEDVVVGCRCGFRRVFVSAVFVSECGCFVSQRRRRHFLPILVTKKSL